LWAALYLVEKGQKRLDDIILDDPEEYTKVMGATKEKYTLREVFEVMGNNTLGNTNYMSNLVLKHIGGHEVATRIVQELGATQTNYAGPFRDRPKNMNADEEFRNYLGNRSSTNDTAYILDSLLNGKNLNSEQQKNAEEIIFSNAEKDYYGIKGLYLIKNGFDKSNLGQVLLYRNNGADKIFVMSANDAPNELFEHQSDPNKNSGYSRKSTETKKLIAKGIERGIKAMVN